MRLSLHLLIFLLASVVEVVAQCSCNYNMSFERGAGGCFAQNMTDKNLCLPDNKDEKWLQCGDWGCGSADIGPGGSLNATNKPATDGSSYLSMECGPSGEGVDMELCKGGNLVAGTTYCFSIDINAKGATANISIYGSMGPCGATELLWASPPHSGDEWVSNKFCITPTDNWTHLQFRTTSGSGMYAIAIDNWKSTDGKFPVKPNPLPPGCHFSISAASNTICSGTTTTLVAKPNGGTAPFKYSWNPGGLTGSSVTVNPTATTTYTVIATDKTNMTASASALVTVNPTPAIKVKSASICSGLTATLSASGANSYTWSSGETTASIIKSPSSTTCYTVTGSGNGCTASATTCISVIANPTILVGPASICSGDSATLTATGASSYQWEPGSLSGSSVTVSPSTSTTYTLTGNPGSSCSATTTVAVSVFEAPSITVNSGMVCSGLSATLTANGANFYTWSTGDTGQNIAVSPTVSTTYTVTGTTNEGCKNTATTIVNVSSLPFLTAASATICSGGSAILTVSSDQAGTFFSWSPALGLDTASGPVVNSSASSTTTYTITGTFNSCTNTATARINVYPVPVAEFSLRTVCAGDATISSDQSILASGSIIKWQWDFGDGGTSAIKNPAHTYAHAGDYNITLIVSSDQGCSDTVSKSLTVHPIPTVHFGSFAKGCTPLCLYFKDSSTIATGQINRWHWEMGNGKTSTLQNPENCYMEPGNYHVKLSVSSDKGCVNSKTIKDIVTAYPAPLADFSASPQPADVLNPKISFKDLSSGSPVSWKWMFWDHKKDSVVISTRHPVYTYSDSGMYQVRLTVTSLNGCQNSILKYIVIRPDWSFYVPNAFTPNADGVNDTFIGVGTNITSYEMWIFDRWGNMIYHCQDKHQPWRGSLQNKPGKEHIVQEDVYVYKIRIKDVFYKEHLYMGSVTVIK